MDNNSIEEELRERRHKWGPLIVSALLVTPATLLLGRDQGLEDSQAAILAGILVLLAFGVFYFLEGVYLKWSIVRERERKTRENVRIDILDVFAPTMDGQRLLVLLIKVKVRHFATSLDNWEIWIDEEVIETLSPPVYEDYFFRHKESGRLVRVNQDQLIQHKITQTLNPSGQDRAVGMHLMGLRSSSGSSLGDDPIKICGKCEDRYGNIVQLDDELTLPLEDRFPASFAELDHEVIEDDHKT